jgi:hypothetical protein
VVAVGVVVGVGVAVAVVVAVVVAVGVGVAVAVVVGALKKEERVKRIISYSGGLGSFAAAHLAQHKYGAHNCVLVFTDTKTEDEDL